MRVLTSGCFDLLHSGHVAFLEEAACLGELHVALGSDRTVLQLKGRPPVNPQEERKFMLESLRCVKAVHISRGTGVLDFLPVLDAVRPDVFFVNSDGDSMAKREAVEARGIRYIVSRRTPHAGLPPRSTTQLRQLESIPYRLDLAGGWLDQPFVSELHPGPVINFSVEPTTSFDLRAGMASSTRNAAIRLWHGKLPVGDREHLARTLFACDNPPGTRDIAGAQDAIGIVYPGLNRLDFTGQYWPTRIESILDDDVLRFIEQHVSLVPLGPRAVGFEVLAERRLSVDGAKRLAEASERCWAALLARDLRRFAQSVTDSFRAQVAMFPHMTNPGIERVIQERSSESQGQKLSGAGGGGYLVMISQTIPTDAIRLTVRRDEELTTTPQIRRAA